MKTAFILFITIAANWSMAQTETFKLMYSPGYRYGIWYSSDSLPVTCTTKTIEEKRSGICNCNYEGKILASTGKYVNGLKSGEWKYYWKTGQLVEIVNYKNGMKNGIMKVYYRNGTSTLDLCGENPPKENGQKAFYIKNQIYSIVNYVNDTLWGKATFYNYDGKVSEVIKYNPDAVKGKFD